MSSNLDYFFDNSLILFDVLRSMGRKAVEKQRMDDDQRKRKWVQELFPTLQANGLRKFSMAQMAASLGVSKATLYNYFSTREELLHTMIDWKLSEIRVFEAELSDQTIPHLERFFAATSLVARELAGVSALFLDDLKVLYPEVWERVTNFQAFAVSILADFYREGIKSGVFTDISAEFLAATDEMFLKKVSDADFLKATNMTVARALQSWFALRFGGLFLAQGGQRNKLNSMIEEFMAGLDDS